MKDKRIEAALDYANRYGSIDGGHHKTWVIDQMVRALLGCEEEEATALDHRGIAYDYTRQGESVAYLEWVDAHKAGEDGPETYDWDVGIAP